MKKWQAALIVTAAIISVSVQAYDVVEYVFYRSDITRDVLRGRSASVRREARSKKNESEADRHGVNRPEENGSGEDGGRDWKNKEGTSRAEETGESAEEMLGRIEKEMQAIAEYLYTEGALADTAESADADRTFTMELDAKGWPYAVVYQEEADFDGVKGYKEQTITYDYTRNYERQDEFVYEEDYYDENGNSVKDTQILDFFLVDRDTMEVTDEHTTEWGIHAVEQ